MTTETNPTSPTSSEETVSVKRYYATLHQEFGSPDIKDGFASLNKPVVAVLASAYDSVVAERDRMTEIRNEWVKRAENQAIAFEIERDRLHQRVESMQQAINHVARDSMLNEGGTISHETLSRIRALSGEK